MIAKQQHPSILAVKCNTGAEDQQNRANHDGVHLATQVVAAHYVRV